MFFLSLRLPTLDFFFLFSLHVLVSFHFRSISNICWCLAGWFASRALKGCLDSLSRVRCSLASVIRCHLDILLGMVEYKMSCQYIKDLLLKYFFFFFLELSSLLAEDSLGNYVVWELNGEKNDFLHTQVFVEFPCPHNCWGLVTVWIWNIPHGMIL